MLANNNKMIINKLAKNSVKSNKKQYGILFFTIVLSALACPSPRQFVIINIQTTINQAMNKFITLILCLCCVFTSAWAEGDDHTSLNPSDANIVGHILDKKTGEHLSFINVYLHGTTIGTTTDATGHYYMKNLPEGKYTLVM